ncbi:hypothetical protein [Humibacter ginsenosidimutans]|nr:hypothetical protein [Humibacter ginsenosidimutans]
MPDEQVPVIPPDSARDRATILHDSNRHTILDDSNTQTTIADCRILV